LDTIPVEHSTAMYTGTHVKKRSHRQTNTHPIRCWLPQSSDERYLAFLIIIVGYAPEINASSTVSASSILSHRTFSFYNAGTKMDILRYRSWSGGGPNSDMMISLILKLIR